jgi:hypothetical protein
MRPQDVFSSEGGTGSREENTTRRKTATDFIARRPDEERKKVAEPQDRWSVDPGNLHK